MSELAGQLVGQEPLGGWLSVTVNTFIETPGDESNRECLSITY